MFHQRKEVIYAVFTTNGSGWERSSDLKFMRFLLYHWATDPYQDSIYVQLLVRILLTLLLPSFVILNTSERNRTSGVNGYKPYPFTTWVRSHIFYWLLLLGTWNRTKSKNIAEFSRINKFAVSVRNPIHL